MSQKKANAPASHLSKDEMIEFLKQLHDQVIADADEGKSFDNVEKSIHLELLKLGRKLMQKFVNRVGPGDLGKTIDTNDGQQLQRLNKKRTKRIVCLFGDLQTERFVYAKRESQKIEFIPSDARMDLPENEYSYAVQDFSQELAVDMPYDRVKKVFDRFMHVNVGTESLERINANMSKYVTSFRDKRKEPDPASEGEILVVQADGKGVPVIHEGVKENFGQKRVGPKKGCKKVATVGCVHTVDPHIRTAKDVIDSLWSQKNKDETDDDVPHAVNKRVMATLTLHEGEPEEVRSKDAVFRWAAIEVRKRIGERKNIVRLLDGDPFLREASEKWFHFGEDITVTDILDLIHVAGHLWEASHVFHEAGSEDATDFVRKRMTMLLEGNVCGVISGLRQKCTKLELETKKKKKIQTICNYFENNKDRMRYDVTMNICCVATR